MLSVVVERVGILVVLGEWRVAELLLHRPLLLACADFSSFCFWRGRGRGYHTEFGVKATEVVSGCVVCLFHSMPCTVSAFDKINVWIPIHLSFSYATCLRQQEGTSKSDNAIRPFRP